MTAGLVVCTASRGFFSPPKADGPMATLAFSHSRPSLDEAWKI
jgi:hypothetical protein